MSERYDAPKSLSRKTKKAARSRQQAGGSWGSGRIDYRALANVDAEKGGVHPADYGAIRVALDSRTTEDPRLLWAELEERLPNDIQAAYEAACSSDLRHFKTCQECARSQLCGTGQDLAALRTLWLDLIALRNRGPGLTHEPRIQVPGSAYGNSR